MKTIAQRVQAGIRFLDKVYGKKWWKKIRLRTLNLAKADSCILGQTDGNYEIHWNKLGLYQTWQREQLGFTIWPHDSGQMELLTSAWKKALKGKVGRNA